MNTTTPTLEQLIAAAKQLEEKDKRHLNRGRPKIGFKDDATIISKMRQRGIRLRNIHGVLLQNGLTQYKSYGTFSQAWKSYLAK
jgi:hypothetical protein